MTACKHYTNKRHQDPWGLIAANHLEERRKEASYSAKN